MLTETGAQFLKDVHGIEPTTTAPGVDISVEAVERLAVELYEHIDSDCNDRTGELMDEGSAMLRALRVALTARDELLREHRQYFIDKGERNPEWVVGIDAILAQGETK